MWQRFTEQARRAMYYAQEEAQNLGHGYVSTEHRLLGILKEETSAACAILTGMGVSPDNLRAEVKRQIVARDDLPPSNGLTLTSDGKRVLDLAYDETRGLDQRYIGSEHILLGLLSERNGVAGRMLGSVGASLPQIREKVASCPAPPPERNSQNE